MGRITGTNFETGTLNNPTNTGTVQVKQKAATQPKSILGGLWDDTAGAVGNMVNNGWNGFKTAWGWFTDHESRPGRALETVLDKTVGGQMGQKTSWTDVLKGLTFQKSLDITGQTLVNDTVQKASQIMGVSSPDQSKWTYKVPAFIGGLATDVATDPFMFVGLGEGAKAGAVLAQDGSKIGHLTEDGVQAVKDILKTDDLAKVGEEGMTMAKVRVANRYLNGEKKLISEGGLTFAGKTILSSKQLGEFSARAKANQMYKFIADSAPIQSIKTLGNMMFNPRWVGGINRELPPEFYKSLTDLNRTNSLVKVGAVDKAIETFGKDLTSEEGVQLFTIADKGVPTAEGGLLSRADLVGKSFEEVRPLVDPAVSDNTLKLYQKYINETLPAIEARKTALGMDFEGLNDHIKNYYPELAKWPEARGMASRPIQDRLAGFQKSRISDEDMAKAYLESAGNDSKQIDEIMSGMTPTATKDMADEWRKVLGLSKDPHLALAKDLSELSIKENTSKFIGDTIAKYGKKISQDEIKTYEKAGYGIYYPKGNLRFYPTDAGVGVAKGTAYAFENPAISNSLNAFSTNIQQNFWHKIADKLTSSLVNIYFYNPATVFYHSVHNVAYNSWLSGGMKAFDNVTKGVEDVANKSELYQEAMRAGALRTEATYAGKTLKEAVDMALGREEDASKISKVLTGMNPLAKNHYMNRVFNGSDNALRMNLYRNAKVFGSTPAEAADFVNHYAGNFTDLSPLERNTFRILYPYYSWFKTNVKANFGSWVSNPGRQLLPVKTWNVLNEALAGRPLWQNAPGAEWKVATGQKDKNGKEIYVNPSYAGGIIPQFVENPIGTLTSRMLSGPIENIVSEATLGKNTYELMNNINTPESMPNAPITAKLWKAMTSMMPIDDARALTSGRTDFLRAATGWDTAHPLWRNIIDAIIMANTSTPLPEQKIKSIQRSDILRYQKAIRKAQRTQ